MRDTLNPAFRGFRGFAAVLAAGLSLALFASASSVRSAPVASPSPLPPTTSPSLDAATVRDMLGEFCVRCHGGQKTKAGINLKPFADELSVWSDRDKWLRIAANVEDGSMPPDDQPQPTAAQRSALVGWLRHTLEHVDISRLPDDPGYVPPRRLTRAEYEHTVEDLFGIGFDAAAYLPDDQAREGGFDNEAAGLSLQPLQIEKHLDAAAAVVDAVWRDDDARARLLGREPPDDDPRVQSAAADAVLVRYLTDAFRRPVLLAERRRYMTLYDKARARGDDHAAALRLSVEASLSSPSLLMRIERAGEPGTPRRLDAFELASRLSYFIWSSKPDTELFELARTDKLLDDAMLASQVHRMLADDKANRMASRFALQWLHVDSLGTAVRPDAERFPHATDALLDAMRRETEFFAADVFRRDRSLLCFVDSDFTYLNDALAAHYGIAGVDGPDMRRVTLDGGDRGGVITQASVLTASSAPNRTSPVFRGKWVLDVMLGEGPPPAPANVPPLDADAATDVAMLRDMLAAHRADPACNLCHRRIDPLGFALESFDATGRFRVADAAAELPDGTRFNGHRGLKSMLATQKRDAFVRNLCARMLEYAIGRRLRYTDESALRRIIGHVEANDLSSHALFEAIATSYPFRYRREPTATTAPAGPDAPAAQSDTE